MSQSYIAVGVHLYQPPTQVPAIRTKILQQCYEPMLALLERYPFVKISLNIAVSLAQHLPEEYLERLRARYAAGQVELVSTIAYHPLAPLTARRLLISQIRENEAFYREHFIGNDPLPGLFPPEMAFDVSLADFFKELGYSWCLADDTVFAHQRESLMPSMRAPSTWIPEAYGLGVLLRSQLHSEQLAFKDSVYRGQDYARLLMGWMKDWLKDFPGHDKNYLYLYVDGETFEHHRPGLLEGFLRPFAEAIAGSDEASLVPLNTIYETFPKVRTYIPRSSWSTGPGDHPYHLWAHPDNPYHRLWNEFKDIATALAPDPMDKELESLFKNSFYSCSPWQFSKGNNEVARWCLPGFQAIADRFCAHEWERQRLQAIINELYTLTS